MPLRNKILQFLRLQSPASPTTTTTTEKPTQSQTKAPVQAPTIKALSTSSIPSKSMSSLSGQTVLVVGGSSGLGFGAAKAAHREGAKVIIASSSESKVAAAVQRLGGASNTLVGAVIDVKTEGGVKSFFEKHGAVDHVVYTAGDGIIGPKQFPGLNLDTSRDMWDVRYWGVLNIGKVAPQYVRQSITCTGGGAGDRPPPGWSAIAPVIGALPTLVAALSIDIAPIRVNVILPGSVKTEMWEMLPEQAREGFFAAQAAKLPVKHVADADEIAEAYLFAIKCKYFTGQTLKVDGGAAIV